MSCSRDCKGLGLAAAAAVVFRAAHQFVVHEVLLKNIYHRAHYASLWNPPAVMQSRMPAMLLSHALYGTLFAVIYTRGYEDSKPALAQGLRYGALIGLFGASYHIMEYFVYPVSCKLAAAWAGTTFAEALILGVIVALIYKPKHEENHV